MEHYSKSGLRSSGVQHSDEIAPLPPCGGGAAPLVNTSISQQQGKSRNPVKSLLVYPRAVKIVREPEFIGGRTQPPPVRGEIQSFTPASRRRLKFTASNAFPALVSQFGMTYHKADPDGRTIKAHLNAFLTTMRRKFPGVGYLWILEFQRRGTAHFHLFSTLPHSESTGHALADIWHRIAEPDSKEHLRFHRHPSNFIAWDMGSGSYLCKYLDKEAQKSVPLGFTGVGRFWGNSRGLVPAPTEFDSDGMAAALGHKETLQIIRTVCRHHEASFRRSRWRTSARTRRSSYTLPNGASVVKRLFASLASLPVTDTEILDIIDPVPF